MASGVLCQPLAAMNDSLQQTMSAKDESKLYEKQLENLERIFPQLMKTLEPRDIVPILRARGFLTSTEWTQINSMSCRQKRVQKLVEITTRKRYWWGPLNHALNNGGYGRLASLVVDAASASPIRRPPRSRSMPIQESVLKTNGELINDNNQLHMRDVQRALDTVTENSVSNTAATLEFMHDLHKKALCSSDQVVYTNDSLQIGTPTEMSIELPPLQRDESLLLSVSEGVFDSEPLKDSKDSNDNLHE